MRLYPAGWAYTRVAVENDSINNYFIEAGDIILVCPYLSHLDPVSWQNPNQFNSERFFQNNGNIIDRYAFYPFGAGPRTCLGMSMALIEMKVILLEILSSHRFVISGAPPIADARLTIFSRNGFAVNIVKQ